MQHFINWFSLLHILEENLFYRSNIMLMFLLDYQAYIHQTQFMFYVNRDNWGSLWLSSKTEIKDTLFTKVEEERSIESLPRWGQSIIKISFPSELMEVVFCSFVCMHNAIKWKLLSQRTFWVYSAGSINFETRVNIQLSPEELLVKVQIIFLDSALLKVTYCQK